MTVTEQWALLFHKDMVNQPILEEEACDAIHKYN